MQRNCSDAFHELFKYAVHLLKTKLQACFAGFPEKRYATKVRLCDICVRTFLVRLIGVLIIMNAPLSIALFALGIAVSGCATAPVPPAQATDVPAMRITNGKYLAPQADKTSSLLIFVRDSGLYGAGQTIYLYINGVEVAGFRPSEKLQLYLSSGEYLIGVQSKPNFGLEQFIETPVRIESSQRYAFRIGIDYNKAIVQRTSAF